jgi:hypothetical protein
MALFTDGAISTIGELLGYESAVLEVAKTEGIDLTKKLTLAQEELSVELEALLARQEDTRTLDYVVVTEALHKWHTFRTLGLVYRDAYNHQLNDRYLGKWQEYDRMADWAHRALLDTGLGMTSAPVPRAEQPEVSTTAAMGAAAATYFVEITWVTPAGDEGAPSEITALTTAAGSVPLLRAVDPPASGLGWNVYAGTSPAELTLQNKAPLGANQAWTAPGAGLVKGRPVGNGQAADSFLRIRGVFNRG